MEIVWEGSVCVDCAFMIANGECPDASPEREAEVAEATAGMALGDEAGFSWAPCGACHCTLGGDRYTAVRLA